MKLIGFNGKMGCGKSTAIEQLKTLYDGPVINVKFAQVLYDIQEFVYDQINPVYRRPADFTKDRKLLQWLGTEWGRGIDQNLWVNIWKSKVKTKGPACLIVCDDVRFDNEAIAIRELGGFVVKIEAPSRCDTTTGIAQHASENGIDLKYISATIENKGSIQDLKDSLSRLNIMLSIW